MIKTFLALMTAAVFVSTVWASGDHAGGHGHKGGHEKPDQEEHEDAGAHQHGGDKSPVGSPAQASLAKKVILVSLTDDMRMNFKDDTSAIKSGTIIQFIVTNNGKIPHEFSVGNQDEQKEHAEMMRSMPGMVHADGNTVTVKPGESRALTWHFEGDDLVVFACNIPGHYEAGMFRKVALRT